MKELCSLLCAAIATLGLVGCETTSVIGDKDEGYPTPWPVIERRPDSDCPALNGRYRNVGEAARQDLHFVPTLSDTVFRRPNILTGEATAVVEISTSVDMQATLRITFDGSTGDLDGAPVVSVTNDLSCEDGLLKLNRKGEGYVDGTSSKLEEVILFGVTDGYLVINHHLVSTSTSLLIFRDRMESDLWYRFAAID